MEHALKINDYPAFGNNQYALSITESAPAPNLLFGIGKKSFLVYHRNKYINVPTDTIAFFYIKYDATVIVTFDRQEYALNYSLEKIEGLLPARQFFRLNRQYLVNFNAVKEVEHYFARKLLVVPALPFPDKLIVSKEKATKFLRWLENR